MYATTAEWWMPIPARHGFACAMTAVWSMSTRVRRSTDSEVESLSPGLAIVAQGCRDGPLAAFMVRAWASISGPVKSRWNASSSTLAPSSTSIVVKSESSWVPTFPSHLTAKKRSATAGRSGSASRHSLIRSCAFRNCPDGRVAEIPSEVKNRSTVARSAVAARPGSAKSTREARSTPSLTSSGAYLGIGIISIGGCRCVTV